MAREVGDLWPQASGTAALGAEITNGGFTGELRPFAAIVTNSGIFPAINGTSGILRFATDPRNDAPELAIFRTPGFEMSVDGGITYPLRFSQNNLVNNWALIDTDGRRVEMRGSGITLTSLNSLDLTSVIAGINLTTLSGYGAGISISSDYATVITAALPVGAALNRGIDLRTLYSDITLRAGLLGSNVGDIQLSSWAGSGELRYRFGPHQSWHMKNSHSSTGGPANDGYWPIAHSGQVASMLASASGTGGLHAAYTKGSTITATAALGGAPQLRGNGSYSLFLNAQENDHPHILMSGVAAQVINGLGRGAMWLHGHTAAIVGQLSPQTVYPTSYAEATTRSLGLDTLFLQTGSGITNMRTGSGIAQFFNQSASASIDATGRMMPINTNTTADTHFGVSATSGITFFVNGKYRIMYVAVIEKTVGNLSQLVSTELRVYDRVGTGFKLLGSDSSAIVRDSSTLNTNTCNGQWMGDIRANETMQLFATASEAPYANNSVRGAARKCNVIIEWISPLSAGGSTRQVL